MKGTLIGWFVLAVLVVSLFSNGYRLRRDQEPIVHADAAADSVYFEVVRDPLQPKFMRITVAMPRDTIINLDSLETLIRRGHEAEQTWRWAVGRATR